MTNIINFVLIMLRAAPRTRNYFSTKNLENSYRKPKFSRAMQFVGIVTSGQYRNKYLTRYSRSAIIVTSLSYA